MSFARMYFAREFGASALAFLTGIEWFMAFLAIPFGYLKDRYGGRWPIYLGALGSLAFTSLIFVKAPEALSVVLSLSTLAWAAAWPSIIATATGRFRIKDDIIDKITFESYGCAANIAAASVLTELVEGKKLEDAWRISWKEVSDRLGGLPPIKYHCSILAVGALKRAIRAYYNEVKKARPEWLPEDLTIEEKQTFEEEELIERLYKARAVNLR